MAHWLSPLKPVELDIAKSYVDFIDEQSYKLYHELDAVVGEEFGEIPARLIIGYIMIPSQAELANDQYKYLDTYFGEDHLYMHRVDSVTFIHDLMNKFKLVIEWEMETKAEVKWSDIVDIGFEGSQEIHVYVDMGEITPQVDPPFEFQIMQSCLDLHYITIEQYIERVVCEVRIVQEEELPNIITRDLNGKPARLKVGKSYIRGKIHYRFDQYDSKTWCTSKGIGSRWHTSYKPNGYKRMMVVVAMTDNDLPDCLHKYKPVLGDSESAESIVLAIEDSLGRPKRARKYDRGRRTERPEDGTLIGCRLDNDQVREHKGRKVEERKDAFAVYIVYRPIPDYELMASKLQAEKAELFDKVTTLTKRVNELGLQNQFSDLNLGN